MATVELTVPDETTERSRALLELALCGDNSVRAAKRLGMSERKLRDWRERFRPEYEHVRRELAPRLESLIVSEQYAFTIEAGRVKRALLAATLDALENGDLPARDIPGALRNVATAEAIAVDKILALSGRPTAIVEHRSAAELVRRLAKLGAVVDASATEIPAENG